MLTQRVARRATRRRHPAPAHRHSRAHCLRILRQLSAYLDDELPRNLCREIRKHLGACPKCEYFLASLKQTINLCRHTPVRPLSAPAKRRLRRHILRLIAAH